VTLTLEGTDILWRAQWPLNSCPDGTHYMVIMGDVSQCRNCYREIRLDEFDAFFGAASHLKDIINDPARSN
jgi:hypothetical protein